MRAKEVTKRIKKLGGIQLRQRGSHQFWEVTTEKGTARTTVAMHTGDLPIGTLKSIEKDLQPALGKGWLT